jgi:hypothetical protein
LVPNQESSKEPNPATAAPKTKTANTLDKALMATLALLFCPLGGWLPGLISFGFIGLCL